LIETILKVFPFNGNSCEKVTAADQGGNYGLGKPILLKIFDVGKKVYATTFPIKLLYTGSL